MTCPLTGAAAEAAAVHTAAVATTVKAARRGLVEARCYHRCHRCTLCTKAGQAAPRVHPTVGPEAESRPCVGLPLAARAWLRRTEADAARNPQGTTVPHLADTLLGHIHWTAVGLVGPVRTTGHHPASAAAAEATQEEVPPLGALPATTRD
jgi:hypothetical protein